MIPTKQTRDLWLIALGAASVNPDRMPKIDLAEAPADLAEAFHALRTLDREAIDVWLSRYNVKLAKNDRIMDGVLRRLDTLGVRGQLKAAGERLARHAALSDYMAVQEEMAKINDILGKAGVPE